MTKAARIRSRKQRAQRQRETLRVVRQLVSAIDAIDRRITQAVAHVRPPARPDPIEALDPHERAAAWRLRAMHVDGALAGGCVTARYGESGHSGSGEMSDRRAAAHKALTNVIRAIGPVDWPHVQRCVIDEQPTGWDIQAVKNGLRCQAIFSMSIAWP